MNGRRIFTETSAALRAVRPVESAGDRTHEVWEECCSAVATAFAAQNSAFDLARFLQECETPPPPGPTAIDAALVITHVRLRGRLLTQHRLLGAGATVDRCNLASVPHENLPALREALTKDMEGV